MGKVVSFQKKKTAKQTPGSTGGHPEFSNAWQLAFIRMPLWVQDNEDEPPYRPWSALVLSLTHDLIGGSDTVHADDRTPELLFEALHKLAKTCGEWPEVIELRDPDLVASLRLLPELDDIEITVRPALKSLGDVVTKMGAALRPKEEQAPPPATSVPSVTIDHLRSFALAAARFFEAEPWRKLENSDVIRIESPVPDPNLRHLTVMGAAGEEFGMLFMETSGDLLLMGDESATELLRTKALWSVSSWEPPEVDYREHDLWEDEGFPFVLGDQIPLAVCFGPKRRIRRASLKLLTFFETVLIALAETTVGELDAGSWTKEVTISNGPTSCSFSLVAGNLADDVDDEFGLMPSPLFMERLMIDHESKEDDPRRQAQELAYEAMEAQGRHRKTLARQALELWPNCADALGVLAGSATDPVEAIELFEQAVAAGEKDLGAQFFKETVGYFWGFHESRPFMRVKLALAQALWDEERYEEAVGHYRELLRLNPNDNQSVRTLLAPALMQLGEYDKAEELLTFYKDTHSASWHYTWALLTFLKESDGSLAKRRLTAAFKWNPHVASFLTGQRPPPTEPSAYYHPGEISEAETMIAELYEVWLASEGAIAWITERWRHFDR